MRRAGMVHIWLVVVAGWGVVGLTAFFGMEKKSNAAPAPVFKTVPTSPQEIDYLHGELGQADQVRREQAFDRLLKIGPPALEYSLPAGSYYDYPRRDIGVPPARKIPRNPWTIYPNRTQLTFRLIDEIHKKHGVQPSRLHDLELRPFGDRVWKIPQPGGETILELGVEVANVGKTPIRFYLGGLCSPDLLHPTEGKVKSDSGTKGLYPSGSFTPLLRTGESHRVTIPLAKLCRSRGGEDVWLEVHVEEGATFYYRGLNAGRYYLCHGCGHGPREYWSGKPEDGSPCWMGMVKMLYVPIEIE